MEIISVYVGLLSILGVTFLSTFAYYNYYLKKLLENKGALINCLVALLIPIYSLVVFGVMLVLNLNIGKYIKVLYVLVGIILICIFVVYIFFYRRKKTIYVMMSTLLGVILFPLISIILSNNFGIKNMYDVSVKRFFAAFSFCILIFSIILTIAFRSQILKLKYKDYAQIEDFSRYILLYIISFSVIYLTLMIIDTTSIYILNDVNQISNFKDVIKFQDMNSIIELIIDSIYFSAITFSTIGYGDICPNSVMSKSVVICEIIGMFYIMYIGLNFILSKKDKKD